MSKSIVALSLCLFSLLTFPAPAFAHILKTDGNIGAVLHIDPEDNPIARSQAGFFLEFKDKTNKFNSQNCDCTFSISESGQEIYSQPLFSSNSSPNLNNVSVFFTFPKQDVYQIKVTGKPQLVNTFQPFTLVYDVRVAETAAEPTLAPQNTSSQSSIMNWISSHVVYFVFAVTAGLFILFTLVKKLISKSKTI